MNEEEVKVEEEVKKVISSVTVDSAKTEELVRRNSTEKASTRSSPSVLSSDEKVLPIYLRASTKSCHDLCKYGKSHVFEAKKRLPIRQTIRQSFPQSSSIRDQEHKSAEVSAPRERRNSSALKVKITSQTEDGLSDKVKGIKKLGLKENEAFEASESMKLPTPLLSNEGEESSKRLVSIETMTPIPIHEIEELSEASEMAKLDSSSPTEKRIISVDPTTPLTWSEESSDGSENMELDSTSAIHAPKNQLGKLSEEPLGVEISTPPEIESMAFAVEVAGSKPTTPSSVTKGFKAGSARSQPPSSEERSLEKTFVKLKTPSPNHKISTATEKLITSENLKVVEGSKRELMKPVVSDRTKDIIKTRIESTAQSRIIKKSPSPSPAGKTKIVEQKNPSSMKKVMSVSPKIIKNKIRSSTSSFGAPSEPSISLKQKVPVVRSTPTLVPSRKLTAKRDTWNKINQEKVELAKPRASLPTKLPVGRKKVNNQAKHGTPDHTNEKVKEKTLYVIEPKSLKTDPNPTNKEAKKSHTRTTSFSSSSSSSRSTLSESKRSNEKRKPIRTVIHSETKLPSPHKLKFQRGKTVSPANENNSPRKLNFRQAKGMSETPNNKEAVRKKFIRRRKVSIGSRAELISPGFKAPAVVLKHQDVQEKKEIQGLLNHVIEETASKLVETRKSKVMALVGAFETVISLQESRVSTATS